jgi:hypothetical protein
MSNLNYLTWIRLPNCVFERLIVPVESSMAQEDFQKMGENWKGRRFSHKPTTALLRSIKTTSMAKAIKTMCTDWHEEISKASSPLKLARPKRPFIRFNGLSATVCVVARMDCLVIFEIMPRIYS